MIKASNNPFPCTPVIINTGGESIPPYGTFRFVKKGFGNSGTTPGAAGDIYEGWVSEGVYSTNSIYDGSGALDNPDSFIHQQIIES